MDNSVCCITQVLREFFFVSEKAALQFIHQQFSIIKPLLFQLIVYRHFPRSFKKLNIYIKKDLFKYTHHSTIDVSMKKKLNKFGRGKGKLRTSHLKSSG